MENTNRKIIQMTNLLKDETGSTQRLQSLRVPRDLSLGAAKASKKSYTPNLNVVRNKNKLKDSRKDARSNTKSSKERHKQPQDKSRFIQSRGVFAEGTGADLIRQARERRPGAPRENGESSVMPKPTFSKTQSWTASPAEESKAFESFKEDDDSEDEKTFFEPITWLENDLKEEKVKNIKQEDKKHKFNTLNSTCYLPYEYQDNESYSDANMTLTLWNLPDSFAGKGLSDDPKCKTVFDYSIVHMNEGKIGKMCVRRSGKIEVYIGSIKYDLEPNDFPCCNEELLALGATDSYNQPSAAVLGSMQNRFSLIPSWLDLLRN